MNDSTFWISLGIQLIVYAVSIGAIYGTITTRLKYMEAKLDKHNNLVERLYCVEKVQGEHALRLDYIEKAEE